MKIARWMSVFVVMAALAATAGARLGTPTATAQDFQIYDRDNGQAEPRLTDPPQGRPGFGPGQPGPMGPQMIGPTPPAAMWGDDTHVYVLMGDRVFKIEKKSMQVVGETRLPLESPGPQQRLMMRGDQPNSDLDDDVDVGDKPCGGCKCGGRG